MIPFAAIRTLIAFAKAPSLAGLSDALTATSQVFEFLKTAWGSFTLQEANADASTDCCKALEAFCSKHEGMQAQPMAAFPIWLLVALPELIKMITDLIGKVPQK